MEAQTTDTTHGMATHEGLGVLQEQRHGPHQLWLCPSPASLRLDLGGKQERRIPLTTNLDEGRAGGEGQLGVAPIQLGSQAQLDGSFVGEASLDQGVAEPLSQLDITRTGVRGPAQALERGVLQRIHPAEYSSWEALKALGTHRYDTATAAV
jgi:hypothetical protein